MTILESDSGKSKAEKLNKMHDTFRKNVPIAPWALGTLFTHQALKSAGMSKGGKTAAAIAGGAAIAHGTSRAVQYGVKKLKAKQDAERKSKLNKDKK